MELPKNITQIGEADSRCKIYAEDYVVTYMNQLNEKAADKAEGMAFYGTKREIGEKQYHFFYGAAKINSLQKDVTHLSGAQRQEIEKIRQAHFKDYDFLGYRILNGSVVEGFYLYEQGIGRYVSGYARFSEKNDAMLNFMMDYREDKPQPEVVDESKYEEVKKRQEQLREETVYHYRRHQRQRTVIFRYAGVACAAVLGVLLYRNWSTPAVQGYIEQGRNIVADVVQSAKRLWNPEAVEVSAGNDSVDVPPKVGDILVTEDALTQALIEENKPEEPISSEPESEPSEEQASSEDIQQDEQPAEQPEEQAPLQSAEETVSVAEPEPAPQPSPVLYTVKKGDTLISISINMYGNKDKVYEICQLNGITNPDNIQEGWKILLP